MIKTNNLDQRKAKEYAVKSADNPVVIQDVDLHKRIVTGLYNTYNFFDSDCDVILPGAAQKSITERGPDSSSVVKIKHLCFHDWTQLPGKIQVLKESPVTVEGNKVTGIYFETKMADTTLGNDTLINYQQEVYDNHSIGFQFLDGEWIDSEATGWAKMISKLINPEAAEEAGFAYLWKEIRLYEGSTVAFGANELTPYLGVKDLNNKDALALKVMDRLEKLNKQLTSGTQSDEMMQTFEMQVKQLRQIISELFLKGPSVLPTSKPGPGKKDTAKMIHCDSCGVDFDAQDMNADDAGAYACPDCNQLCMSKEAEKSPLSFLNNLKFI